MDAIKIANAETIEEFIHNYMPEKKEDWKVWSHPLTRAEYQITLQSAKALSEPDFEVCFHLIEFTSSDDYRKSQNGWKPRQKRHEMKLLDLKYLLVKHDNKVEGFVSFMPTDEDGYPVIYCYEIHLSSALQGTGLSKILMSHLEAVASRIPGIVKIMLTCYSSNIRGIRFYDKMDYAKDKFSPLPKVLRNGTAVEADYVILSKAVPKS